MPHHLPTAPTPYPNMWYLAAYSHHLRVGEVRPITVLGRELVLFRTEDGKAHVVAPHCPHFGAHLGHGGRVVGNSLRCPFHGWRFEGQSGKCVHIPTGDPIPSLAKLEPWHVDEVSGMVLLWYHAEGAPPSWRVAPLDDFEGDGWSSWLEDRWTISATIQDISENDADVSHGPILHDIVVERADARMEEHGAMCRWHLRMRAKLKIFGVPLDVSLPKNMTTSITSTRWGLGIGWICQTMPIGLGLALRTQTLCTTVPVDETHSRMHMLHRVRKVPVPGLSTIMHRTYAKTFQDTVEDDIRVWEHKVYLERPAAAKSDAGILKFRRWAKQFYGGQRNRTGTGAPVVEATGPGASWSA